MVFVSCCPSPSFSGNFDIHIKQYEINPKVKRVWIKYIFRWPGYCVSQAGGDWVEHGLCDGTSLYYSPFICLWHYLRSLLYLMPNIQIMNTNIIIFFIEFRLGLKTTFERCIKCLQTQFVEVNTVVCLELWICLFFVITLKPSQNLSLAFPSSSLKWKTNSRSLARLQSTYHTDSQKFWIKIYLDHRTLQVYIACKERQISWFLV